MTVKARERSYGKDEIIYREGDPGGAVFLVLRGRVELSKAGPGGSIPIALRGANEIFGEISAIDGGMRSATARAVDDVQCRILAKGEFLSWLDREPEAKGRLLRTLAERLRQAESLVSVAQHSDGGAVPSAGPLQALLAWFRRRRAMSAPDIALADGEPAARPFQIALATLNNDVDGAWTRALEAMLAERPGLAIRVLSLSLQIDLPADQAAANGALTRAHQVLAREAPVDLLIWGDVHGDGLTLWLTAAGGFEEDRPGAFSVHMPIEVAGDLEDPAGALVLGAAAVAVEPDSDPRRALKATLLDEAWTALSGLLTKMPVAWKIDQQVSALMAMGHMAMALAGGEQADARLDQAAVALRGAIQRLPRNAHDMAEATLRRYMGVCLLTAGERRRDPTLVEQAVEAFRQSVGCMVKAAHPQDWAEAHCRLAAALYRLDELTGRTEFLKEALNAYQAALGVFTRTETPLRWADVMDNVAQILQVYGGQLKNADVLERAVEAARAALEFRDQARAPSAWAASQNTLGSALFLWDKTLQKPDHLEEAAAAFTAAAEVYHALGAGAQAAVAEKNLTHVTRLTKIKDERKVALLDWAEDASADPT